MSSAPKSDENAPNKKLSTPHVRPQFEWTQRKEMSVSGNQLAKFGFKEDGPENDQKIALLWAMLVGYLPGDVKSLEKSFVHHVEYTLARRRDGVDGNAAFKATAYTVRDRLLERWKDTQEWFYEKDCKRVAYLSLEFLMGRSLQNAIFNLGLDGNFKEALRNLGFALEDIYEEESDAGLGNGGLGRLAACFLDSMATLDLPAWGYGLRYTYGMFHQEIHDNEQVEFPDFWLVQGNPWEIERSDIVYPVRFYGKVREAADGSKEWVDYDEVVAMAYDVPIPGYDTYNTLNIRLWSAKPSREFDLQHFNRGNFFKSIEDRQKAEQITQVLYPNDNTPEGKVLRLKQQYFFVSATLQDLLRRFKRRERPIQEFADKLAVQLNDTHPALAIVEFMRYLLDYEKLSFNESWELTKKTFAYTNHTVLPEALEKWDVPLMEELLPRHLSIVYQINHFWLGQVGARYPGDMEKMRSLSLIEEGHPKRVRMANLAIIGSHTVNGVAKIHSTILVNDIFKDFYAMEPSKFQNKTNGVTPRRWMQQANPGLTRLISTWLEDTSWVLNCKQLRALEKFADNPKFQGLVMKVKQYAKAKLAEYVKENVGYELPLNFLFDVHVKRIHEYKRQLLNILYTIHRYNEIRQMSEEQRKELVPRAVIFGGKAAPGYYQAKLIIKLINVVAARINEDEDVNSYLRVVFIPNYCVSLAETIIPATELSQHISTAGMEASGTSNMKFAMNGSLILGTLDGANVEIREEIGKDNIFIFGTRAADVEKMRHETRLEQAPCDERLSAVLEALKNNEFGPGEQWSPILSSLQNGNDYYLLGVDFADYARAQHEVDEAYKKPEVWTRMSILSIARSGKFSSDRTIQQYASEIWGVEPMRRPGPTQVTPKDLQTSGLVPDISQFLGVSPHSSNKRSIIVERQKGTSHPRYAAIPTTKEVRGFEPVPSLLVMSESEPEPEEESKEEKGKK